MSKAYEKMMEQFKAEEQADPAETPETTPASEEHVEQPETTEEKPEDAPAPEDAPKPAETPVDEPNPETRKKPSDFSPEERAAHAFQRQLAKEREKHARELDELKKGWETKFEELKKATTPPQQKKTRADFPPDAGGDDAYIDYLVQQRYEAERAKDAEKAAQEAEERAKQQAEQEEAQRTLEAEQQAWLANVDAAFGEDKARKQEFEKRLAYCNSKGLGTILDNAPIAADYLLHNPNGPLVMEKMLADKATFLRVFNDRNLNPLDSYYELRQIEAEIKAQQNATPAPAPQSATPAPQPSPMPHLGRPGRQAGDNSAPDIFSDPAAMKAFLRSH